MVRTGRRPGPGTSRAAILETARHRFAAGGYDGTSLRAVAAGAGVDPAVVLHFFGSKDGLFREAVGWPFDPAQAAATLAQPSAEAVGVRIARTFLGFWEDAATRASLLAVLRSAMTHETSAALLREFVVRSLFVPVIGLAPGPEAALRVNLAAGQLVGVAILRYILQVEPVASASIDELVDWLGPVLTHYVKADESDSELRSEGARRQGRGN